MSKPSPIITLLTDFGTEGGYVAAMKGVILGIVPAAQIVDITHQVPAQDIGQAARILHSVYRYYPAHSIHVCVVDPGVGSMRRPVALRTERGRFVAPDNGLLTYVLEENTSVQAVAIENPEVTLLPLSGTFHGRDVFSPAAAHLAMGFAFEKLGPAVDDLYRFERPRPVYEAGSIRGIVEQIDHFGNILTSIRPLRWLEEGLLHLELGSTQPALILDSQESSLTFGWQRISGIQTNYSKVEPGVPLALVSSSGELEIAVNQGSAADRYSVRVGDAVRLHPALPASSHT